MTSVSTSISVGWPIPTNLSVIKKKAGAGHIATFSWDKITDTEMNGLDPSGGGFDNIYWRVSIGTQTYLVYNNPTFSMSVPLGTEKAGCQTCVKIQTIYDLSDNSYSGGPNSDLATSDWCPEVCFKNDPDKYCSSVNSTTVTQNYGSMNMRYARAMRNGMYSSARGEVAYSMYR